MSRSIRPASTLNFLEGINSDASPVNFPANSLGDSSNFIIGEGGELIKRKGLSQKYKDGTSVTQFVRSYFWSTQNKIVIQTSTHIKVYDLDSFGVIQSLFDTITYTSGSVQHMRFAEVQGYLFCAHPGMQPLRLSISTGVIEKVALNVLIRDQETLEDGAGDSTRVALAGISANRVYNILNRGWHKFRKNTASTNVSAYAFWTATRTDTPALNEVYFDYLNTSDILDLAQLSNRPLGQGVAPPGAYIYSAFNVNRSANLAGTTDKTSGGVYPCSVANFSGRVFYGAVNANKYSGIIYYSQVLQHGASNADRCYQANDPTSEVSRTLLPDDGGTIHLNGTGTVYNMVSTQSGLYIFAQRGVWVISGVAGNPFAANSYQIQRISHNRLSTPRGCIGGEDKVYYMTLGAVYELSYDNGVFSETSVTQAKYDKGYRAIPLEKRSNSIMYYNHSTGTLFISAQYANTSFYNRTHCYNVNTKAWYELNPGRNIPYGAGGAFIANVFDFLFIESSNEATNNLLSNISAMVAGEEADGGPYEFIQAKFSGQYPGLDVYDSTSANSDYVYSYASFVSPPAADGYKTTQTNYLTLYYLKGGDIVGSPETLIGSNSDPLTPISFGAITRNSQKIDRTSIIAGPWRRFKFRGLTKNTQYVVTAHGATSLIIYGYGVEYTVNDRA